MGRHNWVDEGESCMAAGTVLDISGAQLEATQLDVNKIVPSTGSTTTIEATIIQLTGATNHTGAISASGQVLCTSTTPGVGYGAGAGGTVTQITTKATGVTLNKSCGQITMNNASLAAGAIVSFVVTCSGVVATDMILVNHVSGGTLGNYSTWAVAGSGNYTVSLRNDTAGALTDACVLNVAVFKAVTA